MRPSLVTMLSSALLKSYFRTNRGARVSSFSGLRLVLLIDAALFLAPVALFQYVLSILPQELIDLLPAVVIQGMISLPILMTSAMIVSGLILELGQGSAISSSEAVNWLPISPREYVASSAISTSSLYSAFLAMAAGVTLPFAANLGLLYVWFLVMLLSALSLLLGAFIVEVLRAVMNRVSSTAYKKSSRFAMATRLIAVIVLLSLVQIAFQPYFLYWVLGGIVGGVEVAQAIPLVWPSIAVISLTRSQPLQASIYTALSAIFTAAVYELASQLRRRYWSPVPISISFNDSTGYVPSNSSGIGFGFSPLASALAMKEFRALLRRKDLARYISIPVLLAVSFTVPTLASPSDMSGRAPELFLAAFIPYLVPVLFSTITIGHEGNSVINLLSLPVKPNELIMGKLTPTWVISSVATVGIITLMEAIAPIGPADAFAVILVSLIAVFMNSFIGLGVGARWPDYTVGSRSRYLTMRGYLIGFTLSGLATIIVYTPLAIHLVTSGGVRGQAPGSGLDLFPMLALSVVIGAVLTTLSYIYCRRGVVRLLSDS